MSIARRIFMKSATLTVFSAGVAFGAAKLVFGQDKLRISKQKPAPLPQTINESDYPVPAEALNDPTLSYTAETFSPFVGDNFEAPNALGRMINLKLVSVATYKMKPSTQISTEDTRQPNSFSLLFSAYERLPEFTSIHKLSHPKLGQFEVFLSQRNLADGSYSYEAVFNHLR